MDPVSLPFSPESIFRTETAREAIERDILPRYLPQCRWFGGKARNPERFEIFELLRLPAALGTSICVTLVQVTYADRSHETYLLPLFAGPSSELTGPNGDLPAPIARLAHAAVLHDGLYSAQFRATLFEFMRQSSKAIGENGALVGGRGRLLENFPSPVSSKVLKVEQSNSAVIFTDAEGHARLFLKLFRKLEEGMNPDVEITRFLSERKHFPQVPAFGGTVEYRGLTGEPRLIAMALGMVENRGDAWAFTLNELAQFFESLRRQGTETPEPWSSDLFHEGEEPRSILALMGSFPERARQLGIRTAQMHLALSSGDEDPSFSPEPITEGDLTLLAQELEHAQDKVWRLMNSSSAWAKVGFAGSEVLEKAGQDVARVADLLARTPVRATKIRTHGDYHLGQVLETGDDFVIIDFEGEPLRPLSERQAKRSPLRDVAGMIRSFHYAAHSGLGEHQNHRRWVEWTEAWADVTAREFLRAWLRTVKGASFVPADQSQLSVLLNAFLLEKTLYEIAYELNNRPDWVGIPLRGLLKILRSPDVTV